MRIHGMELTLNNLGEWPRVVRNALFAIIVIVLLGLGLFFDTSSQVTALHAAEQQEEDQKMQLEMSLAALIKAQNEAAQTKQMQNMIQTLTKEMVSTTEVNEMIDAISKTGASNQIKFQLVKPLPIINEGLFQTQPVHLIAIGDYHSLSKFISDVANLNRLITFGDFSISPALVSTSPTNTGTNSIALPGVTTSDLQMDITINIHYT